jgi:hypothetical protein
MQEESRVKSLVESAQQRLSNSQPTDKYVAEAQRTVGSGLNVARVIQQKDPAKFFNVLYNVPGIKRSKGGNVSTSQGQIITNTVSKRLLDKVAPEYQVRILARKMEIGGGPVLIDLIALLQDEISLSTESNWQSFIPSKYEAQPEWQAIASAVGASLITRWTSRRVWMGTDPVSISMKLRFEADENAYYEVVIPCLSLKKLCLPTQGPQVDSKVRNVVTSNVLFPPGPNPLIRGGIGGWAGGENIEIQIGLGPRPFLYFNSVIVKRVNVTYADRFTSEGYPVSALADITFQTYTVLTKEDLDGVFSGMRTVETEKTT